MIGVIVINYHSEERTIAFVKNELSKISSDYAVVIVDNGSTDESRNRLLEAFKAFHDQCVFVAPSDENLGFAKGNNLGAAIAINQFNPDLLLFANNDIVLSSCDVVDKMAARLSSFPGVGEIGPKVIGLDGELQSPEPFMTFWRRHISVYWSNLIIGKGKKSKNYLKEYARNACEGFHYRLSGSFFMVKVSAWEECGGMDPNTFLYAEEMILSERLKKIGQKVYYYPEVSVIHEHGATTLKFYQKTKIRAMVFESECYYYKKYIGTPSWQFPIARFTYALKKLFRR